MAWFSTLFEFIGTHLPSSLVGVIGGFLTGLLAEPIKARMSNKRRQTEIRTLLYQEVANVCVGIELAASKANAKEIPTPLSAEESLQFLAFDVVYEKELAIIAELPEARVFKSFRERVRLALADAITAEAAVKAVAPLRDAQYSLEGAIEVGLIDRGKFSTARNHAWDLYRIGTVGDLSGGLIGYRALQEKLRPELDDTLVALLESSPGLEAVVSFHASRRPELPAAKVPRYLWNTIRGKSGLHEASNDPLPTRKLKCDCVAGGTRIECYIFGRNRSILERGSHCEVGVVSADFNVKDIAEILHSQMKFVVKVDGMEIGTGEIHGRLGLPTKEGRHHDEKGAVSTDEPLADFRP